MNINPWENHLKAWCDFMRYRLLQIRLMEEQGISTIGGKQYTPLSNGQQMGLILDESQRVVERLYQTLFPEEVRSVEPEEATRFWLKHLLLEIEEDLQTSLAPEQVSRRYGALPEPVANAMQEALNALRSLIEQMERALDGGKATDET